MKAWWVKDSVEADWGLLVHAETRGRAKATAQAISPAPDAFTEYPLIVAWRKPNLDDKPFTQQNVVESGFVAGDEDEPARGEYWLDCRCDLCVAAAKVTNEGLS